MKSNKCGRRQRLGPNRCFFLLLLCRCWLHPRTSSMVAPPGPPPPPTLVAIRTVIGSLSTVLDIVPSSLFFSVVLRFRRCPFAIVQCRSFVMSVYDFGQLKNEFQRGVSQNFSCLYFFCHFFSSNVRFTPVVRAAQGKSFKHSLFRKVLAFIISHETGYGKPHSTQLHDIFVILIFLPFSLYFCGFSFIRQHRSPRKHTPLVAYF